MTQEINTNNESGSKLKKALTILLIVLAVIVVFIVSVRIIGRPYDKSDNTYSTVVIKAEDTTDTIAQKLEDEGIIADASRFRFLSKVLFYDGNFQSGKYYLSPSMNSSEIANTIINGITTDTGFEVPAGLTIKQTANLMDQAGFVDKDAFIETINNTDFSGFDFIDESIEGSDKLEGFIFPGNYKIDSDSSEEMIIITILNEFSNFFTDEYRARADEMGMSVRDIITVASVIEKQTSDDKEKADIAAVIYNKLSLGMEFDELEGGFPDKPLCSPGIESIKAALYPKESDFLYFVPSDKLNGTHVFASSEEEYITLMKAYEDAMNAEKDKEKEGDD